MVRRLMPLGQSMIGRLGFMLVVLLTLALLPLGAIAVWQNVKVEQEVRRSANTALTGLTAEAVAGERALIQSGLGSADALGPIALAQVGRPEECRATMEEFVRRSRIFGFAGLLQPDGGMDCASSPGRFVFGGSELFADLVARPAPMIVMNPEGIDTVSQSLVIIQPVRDEGRIQGYVVVSLPQYALDLVREYGQAQDPTRTVLFNGQGDLINVHPRGRELAPDLPQGRTLEQLAGVSQQVMHGYTEDGRRATFTVVPLISDRLYVLGIWMDGDLPAPAVMAGPATFAFPVMMWLVSVGVAYLAVHRLVIRHIRTLNHQMRRFAIGERGEAPPVIDAAPDELRDLSRTFNKLTRILARDEAELEASLNEKTVLLKEVHHRVKNNLQLIASIISIQARRVLEPETRQVLRSLQDRVMALATIHRSLYQADRLAAVRADRLLRDIVNQLVAMSVAPGSDIEVRTDFVPVELFPDQVVPLSLLVTETVTNALKYVGRTPEDGAWVSVQLKPAGPEEVLLEVINTVGTPVSDTLNGNGETRTNLGGQLINAFTGQLEGELEEGEVKCGESPAYRLAVRFRLAAFVPGEADA